MKGDWEKVRGGGICPKCPMLVLSMDHHVVNTAHITAPKV